MPFLTVCVVVIDDGNILLTKRNDFHIWCLPSGGVEDGETAAEAAIRETKEESGVDIQLKALVGIYSRPAEMPTGHAMVFSAIPTGGELRVQPGETLEVRYFPFDELPSDLAFGHRRRIEDAVQGIIGCLVAQKPVEQWVYRPGREELYRMRDESSVTPEEFYMAYYQPDKIIEVKEL
jgi:ADP-ribose pyrophosphatase YjhB (NUDIX family)